MPACFYNKVAGPKPEFLSKRRPHTSSRSEVFYKKGVLRNFVKFTGRHLCQSLYFNKVAATLLATSFFNKATLLKKRLWCRNFPMNFAKFLRTLRLQNTSNGCFWPQHRCLSAILVKVLRTLRVTTSYSLGRYPKTYLDTILKGSNDINWGNIGDFNANIEHVSVYCNNFGGRHPE